MNNACPKCGHQMHTNTVLFVKPVIKYQECAKCGFNNKKEAIKK